MGILKILDGSGKNKMDDLGKKGKPEPYSKVFYLS